MWPLRKKICEGSTRTGVFGPRALRARQDHSESRGAKMSRNFLEPGRAAPSSLGAPRSRGGSSVGRAPALQAGGRRFESDPLHSETKVQVNPL